MKNKEYIKAQISILKIEIGPCFADSPSFQDPIIDPSQPW